MGLFNRKSTDTANTSTTLKLIEFEDEPKVNYGGTGRTLNILPGNRPNYELVVIPKLSVDCPFSATGIVHAFNSLKTSMVTSGHWSVCPVDKLISLLSIKMTTEKRVALKKLTMIHCIDWKNIHPSAVAEIPHLINSIITPTEDPVERLLNGGGIDFNSL